MQTFPAPQTGKSGFMQLALVRHCTQAPVETEHTLRLWARLEEARVRCNLPQISPERLAALRGMSVIEILHEGRDRARLATDDS